MSRSDAYLPSVDALRVFAILAVIWLHTGPFVPVEFPDSPRLSEVVGMALDGLALFAVPYFFMASGFFFGRSYRDGRRMARAWAGCCCASAPST